MAFLDKPRRAAALLTAIGVALGAFGAHALKGWLEQQERAPDLAIWQTAVLYHLLHSIFLVTMSDLPKFPRYLLWSGILIFSGSLYALVLTDVRWLGAVTPIGGSLLLMGWVGLAFGFGEKKYVP